MRSASRARHRRPTSTASKRRWPRAQGRRAPLYDPAETLRRRSPPTRASPTTCARSSRASSTAREFDEFKQRYGATLVTAASPTSAGYPVGILANNGILFSRVGAEGRAFHRALLPARHPAGVPAEHHRLHGRPQIRGRRHRQGRRQDGDRGGHRAACRNSPSSSAAASAPAITACAAAPTTRASSGCGPTPASRVMGGEQAASVLAHGEARRHRGQGRQGWSRGRGRSLQGADPRAVRRPGAPRAYATARLWDDGIIDPADTRRVLALGLCGRAQRADSASRSSACSGCDGDAASCAHPQLAPQAGGVQPSGWARWRFARRPLRPRRPNRRSWRAEEGRAVHDRARRPRSTCPRATGPFPIAVINYGKANGDPGSRRAS